MVQVSRWIVSAAVVLAAAAGVARADLVTDPSLIKWSQLPDLTSTGFDYSSETPLPGTVNLASRVADDFVCTDPRAVTLVHWWGSYWQPPYVNTFSNYWNDPSFPGPNQAPVMPAVLAGFTVKFYSAVPIGADPTMPYGHPGAELYSQIIPMANVTTNLTGIINRTGDAVVGNMGDEAVWQYLAVLPTTFDQTQGTTYWISIQALRLDGSTIQWGWHNAAGLVGNNAVQGGPASLWGSSYNTAWQLLPDRDMAYELQVPEPFTTGLLGVGLGMLLVRSRRTKR